LVVVVKVYEVERERMIRNLEAFGYLRSEKVKNAMKKVPRHLFVPDEQKPYAYEDKPLPVWGDQTISAPHMVAMMCEALELESWHKVLEIGAGTGYHACVIAQIAKVVYSVERISKLADMARENLKKAGCERIEVIVGDGTEGYEKESPFDRILVTAGAPDVPDSLKEQLTVGGFLLIPVGPKYMQELILLKKLDSGKFDSQNLGGCAFVPLIGKYGW
jgi:protein-L-isoaspartate(D-aspartate) O-methyltransferase